MSPGNTSIKATSRIAGHTLQSLETLRIVAALLVVCAHVAPYPIPLVGQFLGTNLFLGSIGVDLFFVISGVVIGLSTIRTVSSNTGWRSLTQFLIARAFRIFPLYWVVTAVTVFLLWRKTGALPSVDELLYSLALIPRVDQLQYADPIVHIGWTLQFEVFFYALCALGIAVQSKWLPLVMAVALAVASHVWTHYYLNPILLEFAGGYALALHLATRLDGPKSYRAHTPPPLMAMLLVITATGLFLFAATGRDGGYPPDLDLLNAPRMLIAYGEILVPRWIAWGLPALAVVAVSLHLESSISWRPAFLGKYTYSVYMCHTFAISASLVVPRLVGIEEAWMLVLLPIVLVLVTGASYNIIEHPMIRAGRRFLHLVQGSSSSRLTPPDAFTAPPPPPRAFKTFEPVDQITVLLQGNYNDETVRIIERLKALEPTLQIVLSCWETNRATVNAACLTGITTVFSEDPGAPAIPGFKGDNIRRQLVSTRAGLEQVRTPWVVKIRSDIYIDPRRLPALISLCTPIPTGYPALFANKVVATSLTTLDARYTGLYFHVCDWFYLGRVEDVRTIFSAQLPEDDFFFHFQGAKPAPEICSRLRSETYLIYHLVRDKLGGYYPFSGYRDSQLAILSHAVLKTNFAIINPWNLGLRSSKHRKLYLWLRPGRYTELTCGSYFAQVSGARAGLAMGSDLVSRAASAVAPALISLRNRVRTWCR